ncbi:MAG: hypothetical protein ACQESF_02385 [Nanobdellota archaeon]
MKKKILKALDKFWFSVANHGNLSRVLREDGLKIEGKWSAKSIFLNDEKLTNRVFEMNGLKPLKAFHWGDQSKQTYDTALAILLWFNSLDDAKRYQSKFLEDFLSKFTGDFNERFRFGSWRNELDNSRRKKNLTDMYSSPPSNESDDD